MKPDFKEHFVRKDRHPFANFTRYWHLHGIVLVVSGFVALFLLTDSYDSAASIRVKSPSTGILSATEIHPLELPRRPTNNTDSQGEAQSLIDDEDSEEDIEWQIHKVKHGLNLGIIAERAGIGASEIYALMQTKGEALKLKKLYPGDEISMLAGLDGKLLGLKYNLDKAHYLQVLRKPGETPAFDVVTIERPLETRIAYASGTIQYSLFTAGLRAGLSTPMIIKLANIFEWDIDFALEVKPGDRFHAVYEEKFIDGEKVTEGEIIAAEFINNGNVYRAIRYTSPNGDSDYYTPEGNSLRKEFMRNPVDFTRISSRFSSGRKHPILNTIRAHMGVDYAAPPGTPIKASGEGRIVFRGKKGGYGNTIIIQHGQRYSTLYAHMSKFNHNANHGARMKQGQIIGYVGSTGLATGPHLHYEFRVNDIHRNPLTIQYPSAQPIASKFKDDFQEKSKALVAQLDILNKLHLAMNK